MSETATTRPPTRAPVNGSSVSSRGVLVSGAMAGVAVIGYGGTVLLANLMAAPQFREYAAAQMLVGMVGTFASAMIPMPLAHVIRTAPPGSAERRRGMAFAAVVCATLGVAAAAVTGSITSVFAPAAVVCAVAVSTGSLFVLSPVFGWLQGELRFARWTTVAVLEVAVRVVTAALAVLAGLGAAGAIGGFAVGVAAVLLLAPRAITRDLAWRPSVVVEKGRWTETAGIACTQLIVAAIVGADVVAVALLHGPAVESAGYQALSTLGKGPSYVAAGAAVVAFPLLRTRGAQVADILLATLRSFAMLAFPSAALVATVPGQLVLLVIPADYAGALRLLPVLAAAGVGYSGVTLLATLLVALRAYRRCAVGLLVGAVLMVTGLVTGWATAGIPGLADGVAAAAVASAGALLVAAAPLLPPGTAGRAARGLLLAAVLVGVLVGARQVPAVWLACAVLLGGLVLWRSRRSGPGRGSDSGSADGAAAR